MQSQEKNRHRRGSVLIEGALSLMVFLMMTFGTLEFAIAVEAYNFCAWASKDAARWASVRGSSSNSPADATSVSNYVKGLAVGLDKSKVTVTTSFLPNNNPGSAVKVQISYALVPLAGLAYSNTLTISNAGQWTIIR